MKEGFELEAEGGEIVIRNTNGDYAVVPKNKVEHINKLLSDGCHGCIDEFVATLPTMADYAQNGSVVGDPFTEGNPVSNNPPQTATNQATEIIPPTYSQQEINRLRIQDQKSSFSKSGSGLDLTGAYLVTDPQEFQMLTADYSPAYAQTLRVWKNPKTGATFEFGDTSLAPYRELMPQDPLTQTQGVQSVDPITGKPNIVPNNMLNQGQKRLTFEVAKSDNPNASASFQIAYTTPEEGLRLRKDFANIKTEEDLKKSPYYSYVGDDYTKVPTTPIDFSKFK